MITYELSPEITRVAVVMGVVFAVLLYERFNLTTGGAIVPGYLAINFLHPVAIVLTLVGGVLVHLLVEGPMTKKWILYGRRKFEIQVLIGLAFGALVSISASLLGLLDPRLAALTTVGFLLPGLVAHDISRQGMQKTILAVLGVTAILLVFLLGFNSLLMLFPPDNLGFTVVIETLTGFPTELLMLAVAVSVLAGMVLYSRFGIRSGGFITGAYIALISPRIADIVFTVVVAVLTWFIVVKLLMPRLLIFGRRKFATMLLVAAVVGWVLEVVLLYLLNETYVPWRGMTVATLMIPAMVANEAQRQGWLKTVIGTSTSAVITVVVMGVITLVLSWIQGMS